ncbi:MAG: PQQ-binding-like beta-propeller repeat protein [Planctomycetota bacterium]
MPKRTWTWQLTAQTESQVIVLIDHSGPAYLLSLDKETGKNHWKVERKSRASWASPVVATIHGREQIVVSSNGTVDGYDPEDGSQLWTVDGVGGNTIPSVTVAEDRVYAGASVSSRGGGDPTAQTTCCIEVSRDCQSAKILWRAKKASCHYVSPLEHQGTIYTVNEVGVLNGVDAVTGKSKVTKRTSGICWSTPLSAGEHIYLFGKNGMTTVMNPANDFEVVAENPLWDLDNPPKPETYTEHRPERSSRGSFTEQIQKSDKDNDGLITKEELPESMQSFFGRLDTNSDGAIDKEELEAMAKRARERSSSSSSSYGDPIVYGVAVTDGAFFVRTGTRIFCIRSESATERIVSCVVEPGKEIQKDISVDYKEGKLYFSSETALKTYQADPSKYEAFANHQLVVTKQYVQQTCPLSGEEPDEFSATVSIAGAKIEVLCPECAKDILKEPRAEQIEMVFDAEGFELGGFRRIASKE